MNFDSTLVRIPSSSTHPRPPPDVLKVKLVPRDKWAKFAIAWSAIQLVLITVLELVIAVNHYNWTDKYKKTAPDATALTVYHGLFVAAQGFQLYLCFDAVVQSSTIQLLCTTVFNFALLAYSGLQYAQADKLMDQAERTAAAIADIPVHPTKSLEIAVIVFMIMFCIGWIVLSHRLYRVFGWSIFKELGADINMRKRLDLYHIYLTLLKLDVFFFSGFDLQYLVLVLIIGTKDQTTMITHAGIAIPFTVILLVVSYLAIRRESQWLMLATLLGLSGGIGYLVSKLVDVQTDQSTKYKGSRNSLTMFESLTLVLCITTFVFAILNFMNFGKGLKEQLRRARNPNLELDEFGKNGDGSGSGQKDGRWPLE